MLDFYRERGGAAARGQSGAVVAVQRTSSDLKLNPHVHAVFLDGVYPDREEEGDALEFRALAHLTTRDVAQVLERTRDRMTKYLASARGLLDDGEGDDAEEADASERAGLARLAASAVSGATPPAGPEWRRGALPLTHRAMVFERPLCVALDGFTLHAATRAGGLDEQGREALLKYILRPAVAQERVTRGPDGLVRIGLKKAFSDGTVAVDLDPLSLLSRLCASVLGSASKLRARLGPKRASTAPAPCVQDIANLPRRAPYRPWAELLRRTFGLDVLACPRCEGRMRLLAMVTDPRSVTRYLRALDAPTEAPARTPAHGPPYWQRAASYAERRSVTRRPNNAGDFRRARRAVGGIRSVAAKRVAATPRQLRHDPSELRTAASLRRSAVSVLHREPHLGLRGSSQGGQKQGNEQTPHQDSGELLSQQYRQPRVRASAVPGEREEGGQLDGRMVHPYPPDTIIPNPARRRLDRALRLARARDGEARRELASLTPEHPRRARLEKTLADAIEQQRQLLALRPSTPTKAALADTDLAGKLVKHASNYKTAIDTIRIACANAEADLAGELAPFLARPAEAKRALRNLLAAPGHVRLGKRTISVTLLPAANANELLAFERLLDVLSRANLVLPSDPLQRRLRFRSQIS